MGESGLFLLGGAGVRIESNLAANKFLTDQVVLSLGSLKGSIAAAKNAPMLQKAGAVSVAVDRLYDVVEDLAENQVILLALVKRLSDRLDYLAVHGGHDLDAVEGL